MNIQQFLSMHLKQAMIQAGADQYCDPLVKVSAKVQQADYQVNGIMAQAKKFGLNPRELAERVVANINLTEILEKVEVAGPGFINLVLNKKWLSKQVSEQLQDSMLGLTLPEQKQTIVVDYSAPNVAKEMHVGHLRSTIIGDATVRTLSFLGHKVIRANHIGDWGTQFGMLIALLEEVKKNKDESFNLSDLENFYREAKKRYDSDAKFAEIARGYVVKLQGGDSNCLKLWNQLVDITMSQNLATYSRLNVTLTLDDTMGESLYNSMLPSIVEDLLNRKIATESEGAVVVFLDEFKNKDGEPMGVIIRKSDGGYLYTTTDIACAKYRYESLNADRILYYTDSRQNQHLKQVWSILKKAEYVPKSMQLEHHLFGMMLGKDGRPFKTRSGETIKLNDLLDEAIERASILIRSKKTDLNEQELKEVIEAVAIGAVKYADLSKNRATDYVFDWDLMLSFEGNTAPYLQYAYTRILSIFRKANMEELQANGAIVLEEDEERALALKLLQFDEVIAQISQDGLPHLLCNYIYDIATLFSRFYEQCPILTAESTVQQSRLNLAALTGKVIKTGLDLLGIKTVKKM